MYWSPAVAALAAALGIGLLIGAVRERQHASTAAASATSTRSP